MKNSPEYGNITIIWAEFGDVHLKFMYFGIVKYLIFIWRFRSNPTSLLKFFWI